MEKRMPILLLLLVTALITSGILAYVLGKNAEIPLSGQSIDTIVLKPEISDAPANLYLAGRVAYSDGMTAVGHTLELRSNPMTTTSDSGGLFLFEKVPQGSHTLSILDGNGREAARCKVNIVRDAAAGSASIRRNNSGEYTGVYTIEAAADVHVLEINVKLGKNALIIELAFSYATEDGMVTTPSGTASVKDGVIVSPQGNVFLPDGTVVFPGADKSVPTRILFPDDTLTINDPYAAGEIYVSSDGTVTLSDGTVILPGGTIIRPNGKKETPGHTGVIISKGEVTPIGGEPDASSRPNNSSRPSSDPNGPLDKAQPLPGGKAPSQPGNTPQQKEPSRPQTPEKPSGPQTPEEPDNPQEPDDGTLYAYGQKSDGTYEEWSQGSDLDLFRNRTPGKSDKIAPGSSGYYLFQLKNSRRSNLRIQLELSEKDVHLPLTFTVTPLDNNGRKIEEKAVSGTLGGKSITLNTAIAAQSTATYRLEWSWPFSGNDSKDTVAGSGPIRVYTLYMNIHAEEGRSIS